MLQLLLLLKSKHNGVPVIDPTNTEIDQPQFPSEDWSVTPHGPFKEDTPSNAPSPILISFTLMDFIDSYHSSDSFTQLSTTGLIALLSSDPVFAYSKKQVSCETSIFGSEFVTMKHFCEFL